MNEASFTIVQLIVSTVHADNPKAYLHVLDLALETIKERKAQEIDFFLDAFAQRLALYCY
jgi:hypothetical protein